MLTEPEIALIGDPLMLRASGTGRELWVAVHNNQAVEAERLTQRGYVRRRWDRERDDLVYRATDRAVAAQEIHAATAATINPN